MKQYDFLISYDIADQKRLAKIARVLEKEAIRIQYSLFFYKDATKVELHRLLKKILKIYNEQEDDIRVYKIKNYGLHFGTAIDLKNPFII
jgi:CRISPR-associated protein Cas2